MKKHLSSSLFSYRLSAVTRRLSERKMESSRREEEKFSRKSRSRGMQGGCTAPSVQGGIYSSSLRRAIWRVSTENAAAGLLEDCPPRPFFLYRETNCAGGAIFWEKDNNRGRGEEMANGGKMFDSLFQNWIQTIRCSLGTFEKRRNRAFPTIRTNIWVEKIEKSVVILNFSRKWRVRLIKCFRRNGLFG